MFQPDPVVEKQRLETLYALGLLDTPPERELDRITALARFAFRVPVALISLIDHDRQWFKSKQGIEATQTTRDAAICGYTIQQNLPLIIPDTLLDVRTAHNPDVVNNQKYHFYAGAPLRLKNQARVGSLCILDRRPRDFPEEQVERLQSLAALVVDQFEKRLSASAVKADARYA